MEIIKSTLTVGATTPFTFLHVSDIHMAESDENDSQRRREFAAKRKGYFAFSPKAVEFIKEYVKKTGYPLVNTGDMLDFITPENLRLAKELARETALHPCHLLRQFFSFSSIPTPKTKLVKNIKFHSSP
ncbi:MAG: hypothetical protein IJX62_07455 [Clostridia bacterium]|nr:hypothetical protein [Clostridia bacterium]